MSSFRTRFIFTIKGQRQVELFSVREKDNDDLVVLIKQATNRGYKDDEGQRYTEFRFSVHCSPSSDGYTITSTERQSSGESGRMHSHFTPIDDHYSWPLIGYIATNMADDRYTLRAKLSDRIVSMGGYNPDVSTLVYFIIVSDKESDLSSITLQNGELFRSKYVDFKEFRIWVIHAFLNVPSITVGTHSIISTAEPEVNGQRGEILDPSAVGLNNEGIKNILYFMMQDFSQNIIDNFNLVYPRLNDEFKQKIRQHSGRYVRLPIRSRS